MKWESMMKFWQVSGASQERYWTKTRYRAPDDPLVAAYADPKIEFINQYVYLAEKTVLDVGCGNGIFTLRLARFAKRVVGLDISPHMLDNNPYADCIQGSAAALPFRDRSFDVVFEANLLHHVDDPSAVVRELCRVSARYVVFIEPNRLNPLMAGFSILVPAERGALRFSKRTLVRMAQGAGLDIKVAIATGMISQNNTPLFLIPLLKRFDREFAFGEYLILCGELNP
jgi:SAM-dependent methyltransferase